MYRGEKSGSARSSRLTFLRLGRARRYEVLLGGPPSGPDALWCWPDALEGVPVPSDAFFHLEPDRQIHPAPERR